MPKKTPKYEQRLVLFLDFLGFKEIVRDTASNESKLRDLMRAYDLVSELGDDMAFYESKRVTQFSDSIVVSYEITEKSAVFDLINDVALTVVDLANWGYLVRGAVTLGALIHDKRYLLGPALVKAYLMESQEAIYPRVLIDPKVIEIGRKHRIDINSADDEEDYIGSFLAKDADHKFFIDYISFDRVVDACGTDVESYGEYLRRIGSITEKMLTHDKPGIRKKGKWLHKYYLKAIKAMGKARKRFRDEYPELCADVASLPTFNALTGRAN